MAPFQHSKLCFFSLSLLLLLLLLPFTVTSQSNRNVSLGSSLTTGSNSPWLSPSGEFAFGFQRITTDGYLLAIVFDKIPERTVVWSANRNNLAPGGSRVELTTQGRLVFTDPSGNQIWAANTNGPVASHAAMLDTGNFVLAASDGSSLWESFEDPTDTLLPSQIMERESRLIASHSRSNHSEGRFKFIMQLDGNLVMYQRDEHPGTPSEYAYWSNQSTIPSGYRLVFNQSGFLFVASINGTVLDYVFSNGGSSQDFYHRVTLDYDGVLRYYEHPKRNASIIDE
ncbi:unnamed protein product [Linum tenue]|uniref:Bulb-type lectin domain-containing protein n=1 Tax=Linum tenue TaxID=586396 RepID=A0AAV0REA6_9ROSI|nr:unnamed protein product [Linum tenue]